MEASQKQIQFKYFDNYRVTHHIGSDLIEIEIQKCIKTILRGKKYYWKRIYLGHYTPIKIALEFYDKSREEEKNNA